MNGGIQNSCKQIQKKMCYCQTVFSTKGRNSRTITLIFPITITAHAKSKLTDFCAIDYFYFYI